MSTRLLKQTLRLCPTSRFRSHQEQRTPSKLKRETPSGTATRQPVLKFLQLKFLPVRQLQPQFCRTQTSLSVGQLHLTRDRQLLHIRSRSDRTITPATVQNQLIATALKLNTYKLVRKLVQCQFQYSELRHSVFRGVALSTQQLLQTTFTELLQSPYQEVEEE